MLIQHLSEFLTSAFYHEFPQQSCILSSHPSKCHTHSYQRVQQKSLCMILHILLICVFCYLIRQSHILYILIHIKMSFELNKFVLVFLLVFCTEFDISSFHNLFGPLGFSKCSVCLCVWKCFLVLYILHVLDKANVQFCFA